jgi:signal transduction histidine kinase/ActR/RegA family two-component response regulator
MSDTGPLLKRLLTGALFVLLAVAVATALRIVERQRMPEPVSRSNLTWGIGQAATETLQAADAALAAALPGSTVDGKAVLARFDTLQRRLGTLESGEEARRLTADQPEFQALIEASGRDLAAARTLAERLPEPTAALGMRATLEPLAPRFLQLAALAHAESAAQRAADQSTLSRLHWTLAGLLSASLACGAGLAWLIDGRRQRLMRQAIAAKDVAEAANLAKTQSLANISHELRTPLNGVLGMLQMLRLGPLQPQQASYTEAAYRSGQVLLAQISTLLDLARLEGGKVAFAQEPFALFDVLQDVKDVLGAAAEAKNLRFFLSVSPDLPRRVVGDAERLRRVLFALVGNAVKFTETGHVSLTAEPAEAARPGGVGLRFIIRDTGVGIPARKLDTIFEPFSQADNSSTRRYGGAGLGLAIAHDIVGRLGGDIRVTSTEGLGSEFRVTLTLGVDTSPPPPPARPATEIEIRALLVDDDMVSRMVAAAFLRHAGHLVAEVSDSEAALGSLERERFDVVIVDYHMPGISGTTLARRIRDSEAASGRRTPILGLSAAADSADRAACLAAGMDDYLTKPVDNQQLVTTVERLARERREHPAGGALQQPPAPGRL